MDLGRLIFYHHPRAEACHFLRKTGKTITAAIMRTIPAINRPALAPLPSTAPQTQNTYRTAKPSRYP
jgi:hypothetical protein